MNISPSDYIIGIIVFMMAVLSVSGILTEVVKQDTTVVDDAQKLADFDKSMNQYDSLVGNVTKLQSDIENTQAEEGNFLGQLGSLINSGWQSLKLLFQSYGFMSSVFFGVTVLFGVPSWVPVLLMLIVVVIIAFAIFQAIFRSPV